MKIILFLVSSFMLANGCKTQDKSTPETNKNSEKMETPVTDNTTANLKSNSTYDIMEDSIDKYYIVNKEGSSNVFEYILLEKGEAGMADAEYKETIQFEFTDDMLPISIANGELASVKLVTSKQCKCKDAGYYKVTEGSLSVSKKGDSYAVALVFEVDGLEQKLSKITTTVK
jgi:maltodextrin utilization protein YvdJ